MPSFDVVSKIDWQEVHNAVNQGMKEVEQRYDFKGTATTIELKEEAIHIHSSDEYKVGATSEILMNKLSKRGVPLKAVSEGKVEPAAGSRAKQEITFQNGISTEKAREVVKLLKGAKLKVQAAIQGDQVRVSGKSRDELQTAITLLKKEDLGIHMEFENFRE